MDAKNGRAGFTFVICLTRQVQGGGVRNLGRGICYANDKYVPSFVALTND